MARRGALWADLSELQPDVALVQEAVKPPAGGAVHSLVPGDDGPWVTAGWEKRAFRTAVAAFSDRVRLVERRTVGVHECGEGDWVVSRQGTIAAADVVMDGQTVCTAVSVYAPWERTPSGHLYADASAHRILSDLSPLIWESAVPLVVAGDWNILYGYGEHGDAHFGLRYRTVFERALALGLVPVGPWYPNGRRADPWPEELPVGSPCVPTYFHSRQTPSTATRQLDFVFTSPSISHQVSVWALNEPQQWGGSDHCRVLIDLDVA